jgi:hypothetical protein
MITAALAKASPSEIQAIKWSKEKSSRRFKTGAQYSNSASAAWQPRANISQI